MEKGVVLGRATWEITSTLIRNKKNNSNNLSNGDYVTTTNIINNVHKRK